MPFNSSFSANDRRARRAQHANDRRPTRVQSRNKIDWEKRAKRYKGAMQDNADNKVVIKRYLFPWLPIPLP